MKYACLLTNQVNREGFVDVLFVDGIPSGNLADSFDWCNVAELPRKENISIKILQAYNGASGDNDKFDKKIKLN